MEKKARKTGLDILKIFSMIFVIIYHITLYGIDLVNIQQYSMPYWMITGLKCVSIVSVNCFILVTGYFLSKSHVNYKKLIGLWIQVEMYSVGVYLFLCMLPGTGIDFQVKILLKQMLPILTNQYWFFTDYLLLMVFIPLLNIFVQNVSRKKFKRTLLVLLITFSVLPTFNIFGISSTLTSIMMLGIGEATGLSYDIRFSLGIMLMLIIVIINLILNYVKNKITNPFKKENKVIAYVKDGVIYLKAYFSKNKDNDNDEENKDETKDENK